MCPAAAQIVEDIALRLAEATRDTAIVALLQALAADHLPIHRAEIAGAPVVIRQVGAHPVADLLHTLRVGAVVARLAAGRLIRPLVAVPGLVQEVVAAHLVAALEVAHPDHVGVEVVSRPEY